MKRAKGVGGQLGGCVVEGGQGGSVNIVVGGGCGWRIRSGGGCQICLSGNIAWLSQVHLTVLREVCEIICLWQIGVLRVHRVQIVCVGALRVLCDIIHGEVHCTRLLNLQLP